MWQEIADTDRFMGDYKPLCRESLEELLTELLQRAECCPYDNPPPPDKPRKGVYQDTYSMERYGVPYVILYDIVCDSATLYQVV